MRLATISTSRVPSLTANSMQLMKVNQALSDLGHEVRLWLPGPHQEPDWRELKAHYGIGGGFGIERVSAAQALRGYDFARRAVRDATEWGARLLYVWPYQAAALGSRRGIPTVLELHDVPSGIMGPRLYRMFLRGEGARRLLYTSGGLLEAVRPLGARALEPPFAVHAPNGVDLGAYQGLPAPPVARRKLEMRERFTVGYTGHLYAGRGAELMLELAHRTPEVQFVWAGGEPEMVRRWQARAVRRGMQNIRFLGFVENQKLPLVQAACEVLLMPYETSISVSSGGDTARTASPMKVFEYLAAGRAILSSDLPVIREVLNDANAWLVPPEDLEAWEYGLHSLFQNERLRSDLGSQAKRDAEQYSWTRRAERALEGLG